MYRENSSYYHDYLAHHGVKGMKWGVRRFRNHNGSLTSAGKKRYGDEYVSRGDVAAAKRKMRSASQSSRASARQYSGAIGNKRAEMFYAKSQKKRQNFENQKKNYEDLKAKRKEQQSDPEVVAQRKATAKKVAKGAAFVAGTALTAYAVSKLIKKGSNQVQIKRGQEAANRILKEYEITGGGERVFSNGRKQTIITTAKTASTYRDVDINEATRIHQGRIKQMARDTAREVTSENWNLNTRQSAANIARYGAEQLKRRRYK